MIHTPSNLRERITSRVFAKPACICFEGLLCLLVFYVSWAEFMMPSLSSTECHFLFLGFKLLIILPKSNRLYFKFPCWETSCCLFQNISAKTIQPFPRMTFGGNVFVFSLNYTHFVVVVIFTKLYTFKIYSKT